MSKELEALNNIVKEINAYKLHSLGDKNWMGIQDIMQDISIIEQALNELERLKKVEKLLKDYKDILETYEKEADNEAYCRRILAFDLELPPSKNAAYYEGKAAAYRIALTFFKEYLEKIVIKKGRRIRNE